ncbi:hypothetical protein H5398_15820 [Tessaracoccus sp. MC1679]|uniref:hypothetical protein n=1 Tax=Tessaracoccus sp. MC1679 TaxID=2760313 RepID=UPI0016023996|nr:hypothetical protein [Tessaracoccus sp. MC1679]MBB1517418.1 hypothetical protein [Tessaracoccus sp. MC1679]
MKTFIELAHGPVVPLLSCSCGAYDCRVTTNATQARGLVRWSGIRDVRTNRELAGLSFDADAYDAAVADLQRRAARTLLVYRLRLLFSFRDDSMPMGLGSLPDIVMFGAFLAGRVASDEGHRGWAPGGIQWWIWCLIIALTSMGVDLLRRRLRGGDVWLDGPLHGHQCGWHPRIRYLRLNFRRSYGLFRLVKDIACEVRSVHAPSEPSGPTYPRFEDAREDVPRASRE